MNMPILGQAIWGHNWKRTVEISQTNATSVNLPVLIQVLWGRIWKHTVKKSQANATSVNLPVCDPSSFETFENAHWKKSNKCNRCYYASSKHGVRVDMRKHTLEKNQTNRPVWLCVLWPKFFVATHKEAQNSVETICYLQLSADRLRMRIKENLGRFNYNSQDFLHSESINANPQRVCSR